MRPLKIALWILVGITLLLALFAALRVDATTNTSATSTEHLAWDDVNGWWDFYNTDSVTVFGTRIEGYASSTVGDMSLDCATTASGNICGSSNYGICNGPGPKDPLNLDGTCDSGDGTGELTGYAWNDTIGWISFNCDNSSHEGGTDTCVGPNDYAVTIDANGELSGYAWNDTVGWISFNCGNTGGGDCNDSDYKVATSWRATSTYAFLESSVFDTQLTSGSVLQSIVWQGSQPSGTSVDFQIATSSSSSGPWTFRGPGASTSGYYGVECPLVGISSSAAGPDKAICVDKKIGSARYLRYKVRLRTNTLQTDTPTIEDIVLIWSK
ncbi:MAG: hypothetical protein V1885_00950 [Candidatus Brennerbacteria bacterium]